MHNYVPYIKNVSKKITTIFTTIAIATKPPHFDSPSSDAAGFHNKAIKTLEGVSCRLIIHKVLSKPH